MSEVIKRSIGENTTISIGLVVIALGCVTYIQTSVTKGDDLKQRVDRIEIKQDNYNASVNEINGRLSTMESLLKKKSYRE